MIAERSLRRGGDEGGDEVQHGEGSAAVGNHILQTESTAMTNLPRGVLILLVWGFRIWDLGDLGLELQSGTVAPCASRLPAGSYRTSLMSCVP